MKLLKKTTDATEAIATTKAVNPKTLDKLKPARNLSFSVAKDVDFDDCEIRLTVKGNNITAGFFLKGVAVSQQVVLVKPIPTPPPIKPDEIIKALKQIRLNIIRK
ncbi:MAG TPA: hypothetical protein VF679_06000 [Pedobacter sp.]|jgi:hypothetical protein